MNIQSVEITNYKAFLGTHTLKFECKNVFIYGENGSGKSSLYYALKDFFQASVESIDFTTLAAQPAPVTAEELARTFTRAQTNRVADLLETLTDLGQARKLEDGRYTAG